MVSLEKEFDYYIGHKQSLVKKYDGKYLVIKGKQVIGVYDARDEAIRETIKEHKLGTFLVQHAQAGDENISQTFHSRVIFGAN